MTEDTITFQAIFHKAQTVVDGGLRLSLDLSPDQAQAMVNLIKLQGRILEVAIIAHPKGSRHV
jgi:hypothetical protein